MEVRRYNVFLIRVHLPVWQCALVRYTGIHFDDRFPHRPWY